MAISKPEVSFTAQHYLECGTEECEGSYQFFCNSCDRPMCSQCRSEHQKNPETEHHDVVSHRHCKRQLPVEKCKDHPAKDLDIFCEECGVPLCSKCSTLPGHRGHTFLDLEEKYAENCQICQERILQICQYFIPESRNLQKETKEDIAKVKSILDSIRSLMRSEAISLKTLVDKVISENIDHLKEVEETLTEVMRSQDGLYSDYISYLSKLIKEFRGYLSMSEYENNPLVFSISEALEIKPIPKPQKPASPCFTAGQYTKADIVKLLGRIHLPDIEPGNKKIQDIETLSRQLKPIEKQRDREASVVEQTPTYSVEKVGECIVPNVKVAFHLTPDESGRLWVSDLSENLVQTDEIGNPIGKIQTSGGFGYHSFTQDGNVIYADRYNQVINTITSGNEITEYIKTEEWTPLSVHSSNTTGDILVGLRKDGTAKVVRYNKTGQEMQVIQRNDKGQELYDYPYYVAENINGDVCTSDINRRAVMAVTNSGRYRFSYTGQRHGFIPYGLCTDSQSNILVCDGYSKSVHLVDQAGQFLTVLLTKQHGVDHPFSVCVVGEDKLYLCQDNTVVVYNFHQ